MKPAPIALLLASLWFSTVLAASPQAQQWHELRSLALSVCASVLIHFNDYEESLDPRRAEAYHADLARMRRLAQDLQAAPELALIEDMDKRVSELESLPRAGENRYGHGLEALLHAQTQLDQQALKHYQNAAASLPANTRALHQLSLDSGRIQLLYQVRTFRLLPKQQVDISEVYNQQLDTRIRATFNQLASSSPALQGELAGLQRRYQFVRSKLVNFNQNWAPSGVGLYLNRNIRALDQLAGNLPAN